MNTDRKISDLELERFALGELPRLRAQEIERAIEANSEVASRLAEIRSSTKEILRQYPPRIMAAKIEQRLTAGEKPKPFFTLGRLLVPAALTGALALAFAFYLSSVRPQPSEQAEPETILLKGESAPTLIIYRKGKLREEPLRPGNRVTKGDVLQVRYAARGARYRVILSVDGRGQVTLHFPSDKDASTKLEEKGTHTLPYSYELDNAPEFERFFFITAEKPLSPEAMIKAARSLGKDAKSALKLPRELRQTDFLLRKVPSR